MKFIIRDDDVNALFSAEQLEAWYRGIFEICPISICAVPYIKGDYFKWVHYAKRDKKGFLEHREEFFDDDVIHKIGDNTALVNIIKKWIVEGKADVSMHGIHHRNWDRNAPDIKNNYVTGAEFWTDRDMTESLIEAKEYLSKVFGVDIKWFAAPQNMISNESFRSLKNAHLNVNGPLYLREFSECIERLGLCGYVRQLWLKFFVYGSVYRYPHIISHNGYNLLTYYSGLYSGGVDFDTIKKQIEFVRAKDGVFVLNIHSYGFDFKLPQWDNLTAKEAIIKVLEFTRSLPDVEYTTLEKVLD